MAETSTRILDLSEDGIGLETSTLLPPESTLALDLDLGPGLDREISHEFMPELNSESSSHHVRVIGQIAWSHSSGRTGVRFFSPDHSALQQIEQWLFLNAVAGAADTLRLPELLANSSQLTASSLSGERGSANSSVTRPELFLDEEPQSDSESGGLSLSPLLRDTNAIVSHALALTGAKGAALALYEGGLLICRATCGTDTPALGARISTDSGITGECVRYAQVMYCSDSAADPRVDRDVCADLGIRSILALPLFAGERVVGLLEVLSQRPGAFDPSDAKALDLLARPVMGILFAEGKADGIRRSAFSLADPGLAPRTPGLDPDGLEFPALDLAAMERRRRALAQPGFLGTRFYRRALEGTAAVVVIAAVTWLVVWQTRTLAGLKQQPPVVAVAAIPSQAPHADPVPAPVESLADLKTAALKGDVSAQYAEGAKYAAGEGVPQDYAAAARWFTLAAKKGYAPAQGMLGAYYWSGRGVHKDLKQAYFWSVLARDGNDEISKDRVDVLVARLNRNEMLEVQQLLRDWNRKHSPQNN